MLILRLVPLTNANDNVNNPHHDSYEISMVLMEALSLSACSVGDQAGANASLIIWCRYTVKTLIGMG